MRTSNLWGLHFVLSWNRYVLVLPLVVGWFPGDSTCNSKLWTFQDLNENLRCLPTPFQPSRSLAIKLISLLAAAEISDPQIWPPAVASSLDPEGLTHPCTIQKSTQYLMGVYTQTLLLPSSRIFLLHLHLFCQSQTFQVKSTAFSLSSSHLLWAVCRTTPSKQKPHNWLSSNIYPLFYKSNPLQFWTALVACSSVTSGNHFFFFSLRTYNFLFCSRLNPKSGFTITGTGTSPTSKFKDEKLQNHKG